MTGQTDSTAVLGASTVAVGGIAILPYTGGFPLAEFLVNVSIFAGSMVLISFVVTRILRRIFS